MASKVPVLAAGGPLIFRQLFEKVSSTYTYILGDARTKEAAIIDPVLETVERDTKLVSPSILYWLRWFSDIHFVT